MRHALRRGLARQQRHAMDHRLPAPDLAAQRKPLAGGLRGHVDSPELERVGRQAEQDVALPPRVVGGSGK